MGSSVGLLVQNHPYTPRPGRAARAARAALLLLLGVALALPAHAAGTPATARAAATARGWE